MTLFLWRIGVQGFFLFLALPFLFSIPWGKRPHRHCPRCGWQPNDPIYSHCPHDGSRLSDP